MIKLLVIFLLMSKCCYAGVTFKWLGVAGFELKDEKTSLLFDPVISRPSLVTLLTKSHFAPDKTEVLNQLSKWQVTKADAIFISHAHFDHAIDMPIIAKQFNAKVYGSNSTSMIAKSFKLAPNQIETIDLGTSYQIGLFKVTPFESPHPPIFLSWKFADGKIDKKLDQDADLWSYKCGTSYGFFIEHPTGNYVFQQTSVIPSPDPLEGKKADYLFQTIANRKSSNDIIEQRVNKLSAKVIIPLHYDDFFQPMNQDGSTRLLPFVRLEEFKESLSKYSPDTKLAMPALGQALELN